VSQTGFRRGVSGVPRDDCVNGGRVQLAVLNLCVRIKIRVATFDTNHSVTDSTQSINRSIAASIQKLHDCVVKSITTACHRQGRCVRRNDQLIDQFEVDRRFCTCNVHKMPVPVAARAEVCGCSLAEIVSSNPAGGKNVCLL
jgi:hypothetical protein